MKITTISFSSLLLLSIVGCASSSDDSSAAAASAVSELRVGETIECVPTDADEACFDGAGADFCVEKLSIKKTSSRTASLEISRKTYSTGAAMAVVKHARSESFSSRTKKLNGAWDGGDTWVSATRRVAAEQFMGQAAVEEDFGFTVECKVLGAPELAPYLKTVKPFEECNGTNTLGQKLRCVVGAKCLDEEGDELALSQSKKGTCMPDFLRTAHESDACNTTATATGAAVILCARNEGLHCKDAAGVEIALAERNAPAGTCQR